MYSFLTFLCGLHIPSISPFLIGHPNNIWRRIEVARLIICLIFFISYYFMCLMSKCFPRYFFLRQPLSLFLSYIGNRKMIK
jgi:hypothetical protein